MFFFFLFLSNNTVFTNRFIIYLWEMNHLRLSNHHMIMSTAILQNDILQHPNSRSGEVWEVGVWSPEISSPKLRCRETYWRASRPSPLPFTRVCPFSSRSTTCIIGSPYPENIHMRTLETNALYSIPWDNSYFPPRLSLMITFWHCIINVCQFSVDSTYRYCSSVRFVNMVSGRSSSLLKDSDLEISNS